MYRIVYDEEEEGAFFSIEHKISTLLTIFLRFKICFKGEHILKVNSERLLLLFHKLCKYKVANKEGSPAPAQQQICQQCFESTRNIFISFVHLPGRERRF